METDPGHMSKRGYVTIEEAHEAKSCRTCHYCIKPNTWQFINWECKSPQNIEQPEIIEPVSGDYKYTTLLCIDVRVIMPECSWYKVDQYLPIKGIRGIDNRIPLNTYTMRKALAKTSIDDIT